MNSSPEKQSNNTRTNKYIKCILVFLGIIFIFLCAALFQEYRSLRRLDIIRSHELWRAAIQNRGPLTVNDINLVQPWMTFDYINRIFNPPPDYLKTDLGILDPQYPRITISRYARNAHIDINAFTEKVKIAIRNYLVNKR